MRDVPIAASVNGSEIKRRAKARQSLADFLREELEFTGTHVGCEHGVCGACTVMLDGEIVRSCLCLAAQIDGCRVDTVEGLSELADFAVLQEAFLRHNAAQCAFCAPGMLIAAHALLRRNASPSRAEVRDHLSGNFCRCTGYQAIVDAVMSAAAQGRAAVAA